MGLKFVGKSACRTLADFLSRLTAFKLGAKSISAMLAKTLVHVTLMTIPHWFTYARAPTNCLVPPHTNRQGPTKRFEIIVRQAPILSQTCLNLPHTSRQEKIFKSASLRRHQQLEIFIELLQKASFEPNEKMRCLF